MDMTKTMLDPITYYVQQLSELEVQMRAVDTVDNQGEPCDHCSMPLHKITVTLYGTGHDGHKRTDDCCVFCIPPVVREHYNQLITVVAEVAR